MSDKHWTATVKEDPFNPEECILEFPEDMMLDLGWMEGDTIIWDVADDGTVTIKKQDT